MIKSSAAQQFAVPDDGRSTEVIVDLQLLVRGGKCRADQNATTRGDICEQAVFNAVACAAIDGPTVGEERQLPGAVADHVRAGDKGSKRLVRRRRPDRKAIV